jgi:hypothetical protein
LTLGNRQKSFENKGFLWRATRQKNAPPGSRFAAKKAISSK